jgi:hypothetical protein
VRWFASEENKGLLQPIVSVTGVMRVRLCKDCCEEFIESCGALSRLSLLVIEWIEFEYPSVSVICQSLNRLGFSIDSGKCCFMPSIHNRDLGSGVTYITYFAAIRFGDCQRSWNKDEPGVIEPANSDAGTGWVK